MIAYKLFRLRKDGTIGPLFINAKLRIPVDEWLQAETHHHKAGFAYRPGWHCCSEQTAPHLSKKGRVWAKVEIEDFVEYKRPDNQGGIWFLANKMKVLEIL
jgi:hypothetical protein